MVESLEVLVLGVAAAAGGVAAAAYGRSTA